MSTCYLHELHGENGEVSQDSKKWSDTDSQRRRWQDKYPFGTTSAIRRDMEVQERFSKTKQNKYRSVTLRVEN